MSALAPSRKVPLPRRLRPELKPGQSLRAIHRLRQQVATEVGGVIAQDFETILGQLAPRAPRSIENTHIRLALTAAEQGLVFARELVQQLRRSDEDLHEVERYVNIGSALAAEMDYVLSRASIANCVRCHTPLSLPHTVAHEILQIAREAATNAAKHSGARSVIGFVSARNNVLLLRIQDDGTGFDPSSSSAGFGLLGLTERARSIGAVLSIDTCIGKGTTVTVHCPL